MTIIDSLRPPPRRATPRTLDYSIERDMIELHGAPLAGIDEAGRGPWAGPVVAAAVILDPNKIPNGVTDSKALNGEKRSLLFRKIMATAQVGIGIADTARIDRDNILQATLWAMSEAVKDLDEQPEIALVDGNKLPRLECKAQALVKGDARCISIAAASIIAKVTRDRMMEAMAKTHPGYGFERHKGYGTREHQAALDKLGVCEHHRRSFKPIQLKLGLL
jgi:ribonuclease HII